MDGNEVSKQELPKDHKPQKPQNWKEWKKEPQSKSPARDLVKQKMKELDSNLWDDLSDLSDNAPPWQNDDEELKFISELDNDWLEFERMLANMKNEMMYL